MYRGRLILYGCGDFIDDYEGITGHREYRDDLRLMYFASLRRPTGELAELRMVPMRARKMRLSHAPGRTGGGWPRRSTGSAARSGRRWSRRPTVCLRFTRPLADGSGQASRW